MPPKNTKDVCCYVDENGRLIEKPLPELLSISEEPPIISKPESFCVKHGSDEISKMVNKFVEKQRRVLDALWNSMFMMNDYTIDEDIVEDVEKLYQGLRRVAEKDKS